MGEDNATIGDFIEDHEAAAPFELVLARLNQETSALCSAASTIGNDPSSRCDTASATGEPKTLDEVGRHFNVTRERIRQIESKALAKMRHPSSPGGLRELAVS